MTTKKFNSLTRLDLRMGLEELDLTPVLIEDIILKVEEVLLIPITLMEAKQHE